MRSYFDDVGKFHVKMGLPVALLAEGGRTPVDGRLPVEVQPQLLERVVLDFRTDFLFEELREWIEANAEGDLARAADALVDLVYVALGTAHFMGLPFNALWNEVQRANLEKRPWREGDPIKPRNSVGALDIVKPEGWRPPDVEGVLGRFMDLHWPVQEV